MPSPAVPVETVWGRNVFYWSVRPSISLLPIFWTRCFPKDSANFVANWYRWSVGQGHETVTYGVRRSRSQGVKGQGHRRPKVKVTGGRSLIWRPGGRTILDHLGSNRFSSFCLEFMYGSASTDRLEVHYFKLSTIGGRAFLVAASQIWKSLPDTVVSASTLQSFQHLLKTFLFQWSFIY